MTTKRFSGHNTVDNIALWSEMFVLGCFMLAFGIAYLINQKKQFVFISNSLLHIAILISFTCFVMSIMNLFSGLLWKAFNGFILTSFILVLYHLYRYTIKKRQANIQEASDATELDVTMQQLQLKKMYAKEIMTPRLDMICLYMSRSIAWNLDTAIRHLRTRYPVIREDIDDIIGFVHMKDLLMQMHEDKNNMEGLLTNSIRPIITVPETIEISLLLQMMQKRKTQIALLIDEYGGSAGIVTLEDIIEQLVGDIQDEFDHDEQPIVQLSSNSYLVNASMSIEYVNEQLKLFLECEYHDSIGGLIYENIQFPPHLGQSYTYINEENGHIYEMTIEEMDALRIKKVKLNISYTPIINQSPAKYFQLSRKNEKRL